MLLPRKTIMKARGAASSSVPSLLDRPIGGLSSSILERPIGYIPYGPQRPSGAYYLFMLDFKKTDECESAVKKAAAEKWTSLTEAEKSMYEVKALERRSRYVKYLDATTELRQKQGFDALVAGVPLPEGGEGAQLKRISELQAENDAVGQELQKQLEAARIGREGIKAGPGAI